MMFNWLQAETTSYFVASKHKLSVFFALIFRFSSCQHPLLASALAKMSQDDSNRAAIGKDESALRQLLSMMLSDNPHVVSCYSPADLILSDSISVDFFILIVISLLFLLFLYYACIALGKDFHLKKNKQCGSWVCEG